MTAVSNSALANLDAERSVLATCMQSAEKLCTVATLLRPESFNLPSHRRVFACLVEMVSSSKPIDLISVSEELGKRGDLQQVGGVAYLSDLTSPLMGIGSLEHHTHIVSECFRRRRLVEACERGISAANDASEDTASCLGLVQESLLEIEAATVSRAGAPPAKEFMPEVVHELELEAKQLGLIGLSTGIPDLDEMTTGHRPGELWAVGGLPGRAKTAFGIQVLMANGQAGVPSVMFSLEMSRGALGKRMLAAHSTIPASHIREPQYIGRDGWPALRHAAADIARWPLYVDDSASLHVRELVARAMLYIRRFKCKLVIVDYLRLVEAPGRDLRERVAYVADALRQLAKMEQVSVLLLSQLRRPQGGLNDIPTMLDLKESGDIEAHAHVVLLLYMPVRDDGELTGRDEIIVGKQREGRTGPVYVTFNKKRLRFEPREVAHTTSV
ncbi:putative Replicative DNA helicase [Acidobacteriia bacterium SbA2]|nr:putative Replicative DNA helicase [Acidobacteriia bacterium SbA2]